MLSERRGAAWTPRPEPEWLGAALTQEIAPLHLEVCYTSILLLPRAPNLDPTTPPTPFIPHLFPWLPTVARVRVCTYMHACSHVLVTGLCRAADCHPGAMPGFLQSTLLPSFVLMNGEPPYQSLCLQSRVDPWSPTAGLLAPSLSACFLSTHKHTLQRYNIMHRRHVRSTKCQSTSIHQLKTHTLKAHKHKEPANPPSLFLRFFLVAPSCSKKYLFQFLGERQKKSHLSSSSLAHAKIINAFQRGPLGATPEERRQEDADIAPGLRLEIISEEQSLGLFYSYQDSSYLTCILVFTQSPP